MKSFRLGPGTPPPAPISQSDLEGLAGEVRENFAVDACIYRVDGRLILPSALAPSPEAWLADYAILTAPTVREEGAVIRLIAPIMARRRIWGQLLASFCPFDPQDPPSADQRIYARAAAPQVLKAINGFLQARLIALQQADELEELTGTLLRFHKEVALLYRLGAYFNITAPPETAAVSACDELRKALGYHRSVSCLALLPTDDARQGGPIVTTVGPLPLDEPALRGLLDAYKRRGLPWGQPSVENHGPPLKPGHAPTRLLSVPLCYQSEILGILVAVSDRKSPEFDSRDAQLLANIATHAAAHWRNYLLFAEIRELLYSLIKALVSAIDAKDPYTHGHSGRVAYISKAIAAQMGLDARQIEDCYLAGLLHDIGKIGVREEVLGKTSSLTVQEWEHLKQHPDIGARILEPIGPIAHIVPAVRFHHEAYNGAGYPLGLSGDDIPLLARIVAVADSFDAMSTDRPYRPARTLVEVRAAFEMGRRRQWDDAIVSTILEICDDPDFFGNYRRMLVSSGTPSLVMPSLVTRERVDRIAPLSSRVSPLS